MDIGEAVRAAKDGARVTRDGWNGAGMWVSYQAGYPDGIPINRNTASSTGIPEGTVCPFAPYLMMWTGATFVPWPPSQADLLAQDWRAV